MSININHSNSGNVILQASDVQSESTFIFPNLAAQASGKILISGLATIDDISGLRGLVYGGANTFIKNNTGLYQCAISQNTPGEDLNLATGDYSIALGYNSCASYNYQISHGVNANDNLGWKQSSQYICSLNTTADQICSMFADYQHESGYSNAITYIKGNAIARGLNNYAVFDFSAVTVNGSTSRDLHSNETVTGSNNVSAGFFIESSNDTIFLKVSGNADTELNWLVCVNELKLKTS
jgi:hypothetical protein